MFVLTCQGCRILSKNAPEYIANILHYRQRLKFNYEDLPKISPTVWPIMRQRMAGAGAWFKLKGKPGALGGTRTGRGQSGTCWRRVSVTAVQTN